MPRYVRRQVEVSCVQFHPWVLPFPAGVGVDAIAGTPDSIEGQNVSWYFNATIGRMPVRPGDWIVTHGEKRWVVEESEFPTLYAFLGE